MRVLSRKRAQITVFIILGIVILMTVVLFVVLRERTTIFRPERVIPPEIAPMDKFISSCLETISRDGIIILGNNGGFIEIPREIDLDRFSYLSITPLFPELKTPLWYYNHENRMPTEDYIKNELEVYIEANLDECLEDLAPFKAQYKIKEEANKSVVVDLQDRATIVKLEWPLEINIPQINQTTSIDEFIAEIPIRLKTTYELAKAIMEESVRDKFIETKTLTMIDIDSEIPYTDVAFTCSPKLWFVEDVRSRLQDLLVINIPHIKVGNTDFIQVSEDERPFEYHHFTWDVIPSKSDLKVGFTYDKKWQLSFRVRPSSKGIMRSNAQKGEDLLSLFCMHIWHFTYDVRYPVLVTVKDDVGRNHEEYVFNFGMQIDINHNTPSTAQLGRSVFDFEQTPSASQFCTNDLRHTITVFTYENVSTELASNFDPLNDVKIDYKCIKYNCEIGTSEYVSGGAEAMYEGVFPYCINGILRGEKQGYIGAEEFFTADTEKDVRLYLTPFVERDYEVVKHFQATVDSAPGVEQELDSDEQAFIQLKIKKPKLESYGDYPGYEEQRLPLKLLAKADYTYELEIWLIEDDKIVGGYNGNWTVDWDELARSDKIKFHIVETPYNPNEIDQYMTMISLGERSKSLPRHELT